jgi:hypothetical protein
VGWLELVVQVWPAATDRQQEISRAQPWHLLKFGHFNLPRTLMPKKKKGGKKKPLVPATVFIRIRPLAKEGGHAESGVADTEGQHYKAHADGSVTLTNGKFDSEYTFPKEVLSPPAPPRR